jgi:pantoate kinase
MKAFCPFHVTGFFALKLSGSTLSSIGCGIVIADGATTEAFKGEGSVYIDGKPSLASTTRTVVDSLCAARVDIRTELAGPVGCGLGTSGAGALSTALSLNQLCNLNHSFNKLCETAQRAEIINKTGVGDVIAQAIGGIVIRRQDSVDRIPSPPLEISYHVFGPLSTPEILGDQRALAAIKRFGSAALKKLIQRPTFDEFMYLSRQFASDTELLSQQARDAIEAVEAGGGRASTAMLGDTVFGIDPSEALSEFGTVRKTMIYSCGAHLVP